MLNIYINGECHPFEQTPNIARVLESLQLTGKRLAVERNGHIVPRAQYIDTLLVDNDRLEIVVAVGGG